ncbi:MAG: hypothetical protein P1V97_26140 [Planctomycetota bacterium]|nr:hypothetical protein [Planctomycetota bacterium]
MNTCPGTDLLLLLDHDLIEDTDTQSDLTNHVESCAQCQSRRGQLSIVKVETPLAAAPFGFFQRISDQIERDRIEAEQRPESLVHIKLQCTFCKDKLESKSSVYCGSCLAPYHKDCFAEYGRCAVQGCEEKRFVQTQLTVPKPRRIWPFAVMALCSVAGGMAAYTSFAGDPETARVEKPTVAARAPIVSRYKDEIVDYDLSSSPTIAMAFTKSGKSIDLLKEQRENQFRIFDVKDLVSARELSIGSSGIEEMPFEIVDDASHFIDINGKNSWITDYLKAFRYRKLTINFSGTPLTDVIAFLQDITGLNIVISGEVPSEKLFVNLSLREIFLRDAFYNILSQSGLSATLKNESLVIHKNSATHRAWVDQFRNVKNARKAGFSYSSTMSPQEIVAHVVRETGEKNWKKPTEINYDSLGIIIAKNKPVLLNKVAKSLRALRLNKEDPKSQKYWFQETTSIVLSPSQIRIYDAIDLLDSTRINLNFSETQLKDIVSALNDLMKGQLRFRLDPALRSTKTQISYNAQNVSLTDAMTIITKLSDTAFDVDRLGICLRSTRSPNLENMLLRGSSQLFAKGSDDTELHRRLRTQRIDLNFDETPIEDCLNFLRDITGLNIVVSRNAQTAIRQKKLKASIRLKSVALTNALNLILNQGVLSWQTLHGVLIIVPRSEQSISAKFKRKIPTIRSLIFNKKPFVGRSLGDFARQLEKATRLHVVFPEGVQSPARVTIPVGSSVGEALAHIESQAGAMSKFGDIGPQRAAFVAIKVLSKGPISRALELRRKAPPEFTSIAGINEAIHLHRMKVDELLGYFQNSKETFQNSTKKRFMMELLNTFIQDLATANADTIFLSEVATQVRNRQKNTNSYLETLPFIKISYKSKKDEVLALDSKWKKTEAQSQKAIAESQKELMQLQKMDLSGLPPASVMKREKRMTYLKDHIDGIRKNLNLQDRVHRLEIARLQSSIAAHGQRLIELHRSEYDTKLVIRLFENQAEWKKFLKTSFVEWRRSAKQIAKFQAKHRLKFDEYCPAKNPSPKSCQCGKK